MAMMKSIKTLGKQYNERPTPAIGLTKRDPQLAAMVAKAVPGIQGRAHDQDGNRKSMITNAYVFRSILQKRAKRNADAKAVLKLLPDIELAAQILTSSILSPKDMTSTELIHVPTRNLVSSELQASLISRIKDFFDVEYNIREFLPAMVREPLFEEGSYPVAVIPENAIDEIINGGRKVSTESFAPFFNRDGSPKPAGILGPRDKQKKTLNVSGPAKRVAGLSLESFGMKMDLASRDKIDPNVHYNDQSFTLTDKDKLFSDVKEDYLTVTDNINVLKAPSVLEKLRKTSISNVIEASGMFRTGLESAKVNDYQVERAIFRSRTGGGEIVSGLKSQHELTRGSVGIPMVLKLPSESVLPVHVPGNPKHHVAYFVMLDEEGYPISCSDGDYMHPGLKSEAANSVSSNLIKKVSLNLGDRGDSFDPMNPAHIQYATQLYADMVERDLISRIRNGIYSSNVAIARNDEVYRLMLSRVLQRRHTQMLYIPKEYLTYIAFKHGDDGVGRSLLDDQVMINTMRSVLLFNDVLGSVKNAIGRTKVTVSLDRTDPNPFKTMEHAADEIVRSRTIGIPLGISNPADVMEFIQRAGYEFEFVGHDGVPDTKFDFQQTNTQYQKSDDGINETLRKASIMGFGLSPETVDSGFNTEFAVTATNNNILLAKRVIVWQDLFTPQISEHMRQMLRYTEGVNRDLREMLEKASEGSIYVKLEDIPEAKGVNVDKSLEKRIIIDYVMKTFIDEYKVMLPRPASVTVGSQAEELKSYSELLEEGLNAYLSSDMFTQTVVGEVSSEANTVRTAVKAYFIRKFMAEKNILPELVELVTNDDDGNPQVNMLEEVKRHVEAITKAGVKQLIALQANKKSADADLKKAGVVVGDNGDTGSSGGYDSGSSDFGGDFGGGDGFGSGDGFGDSNSDIPGMDDTGNENPEENENPEDNPEEPNDQENTPENPEPDDTTQ